MSTAFKDCFSGQAASYAAFRPTYPPALFTWLAEAAPRRALAWDAGTGSGQAAAGLADHFARVVATDASPAQVARAAAHPRIEYRVAPAEASGLPSASADLVTVAQALHWFDVPKFFAEARRVLEPGGLLAVWCYGDPGVDDPVLDRMVRRYNRDTVEKYWPPERDLVLDEYRTISLPFDEMPAPQFTLEAAWTLPWLVGYLQSWSATARYAREHGWDPVVAVEEELRPAWGEPEATHLVRWPLTLRVGRA